MRATIAADVEKVVAAHENKSESLRGSRLAADAVKIVIVARKNKNESLREARLAADAE